MVSDMEKRLRALGYDELLDTYNLRTRGIATLRVSKQLVVPQVLSPESYDPLPGYVPFVKLTKSQYREVILAMFGDDPGTP